MKPSMQIIAAGIAAIAMTGCAELDKLMDKDDSSVSSGASSGASTSQQARQQSGEQRGAPPMATDKQLVRNVQQQLEAKGVDAGPIDGIWGPQTSQGVREFQQAEGIEATGQLDMRTLAALGVDESASAGGTQGAKRGDHSKLFERVDKNDDGAVSRSEFESTLGAERSRPEQARGAPRFQNLDANDDGYVSLAEAGADTRISRDFNRADKNGDGRLSRNEFRAALQMGQGGGKTASAGASTIEWPSKEVVMKVQQTLNAKGFDAGAVNGVMNSTTVRALRNFQEKEGLKTSGDINRETLSALEVERE